MGMCMRTIRSGPKFIGWIGFHIFYVLNALYVFSIFYLYIFFVYFFRHIGHVGWDPNTGFDVSVFSSHKYHCSKYVVMLWLVTAFINKLSQHLFINKFLLIIFVNSSVYLNVFMYIYH